jgi:predicted phosphodiesterase
LEQKENVLFLNPGSPALPKGEGIPTVGLIETTKGERKETQISILDFERRKVLHCTTMG